jgi:cbb3-type cytochrome oxidase subunit 3
MSLADVMSASGLSVWAEAALLLSLAVFAAVTFAAFSGRNRRTFERARFLPLDDGAGAETGSPVGRARAHERN